MRKVFASGSGVSALRLALAAVLVTAPGFATVARTAERLSATSAASSSSAVSVHTSPLDAESWDAASLGGIDPTLFALALESARNAVARGAASDPGTLSVIDFSKPSTEKRMWVYDLRSHALLFHELVAHGRGSGDNLPTQFSNAPDSNRSSLGLYRTGEAYIGKHGYSLRLDGLERGVNDRARERAIVIHGADYVNGVTARAQGRLGRSLGCPAVRPEIATPLIQAVKDGGLLFAYYPEKSWLGASAYLD